MLSRVINFFDNSHVISSLTAFSPELVNNHKLFLLYSYNGRVFSTSIEHGHMGREVCEPGVLLDKLNMALRESKDEEALNLFSEYKRIYGHPSSCVVSKLITGLSYSYDHCLLQKAYEIGFRIATERFDLIQHDTLSRLCLSLARAHLFVPVSRVLRLMVQKNDVPSMDVLGSVFMHLVKTEAGTSVATNVLIELCDSFCCLREKRSECALSMKPSTLVFNVVLDGCVRFGSSLKGQEVIEVMARTGVVADACSVVLFACIYEMNGQRDELMKFREYVDRVSVSLARDYSQFYDKLISLHFGFDDIDSAAKVVMDMYDRGSCPLHDDGLAYPCSVSIGSPHLKGSLKIQVMFDSLKKDSFFYVKDRGEFVIVDNGKLTLTNKAWAQLIVRYKRSGRITELSKVLIAVDKKTNSHEEISLCHDVIHACINNGWLETAHDILDDMEMANVTIPTSTYMLLLNAYCRENMSKEVEALAKQMKRLGLLLDTDDVIAHGSDWSPMEPVTHRQSKLANCLMIEMKKKYEHSVKAFEINSCIYFFCKAKMMEDALMTYRKLHSLKIQPTVHTFYYLIQGFSCLGMYREITILWGDIKRFEKDGSLLSNRNLYEALVINFIRGGYFERVMEVLSHMKEHSMYADRWMYKNEFTRLHKNLYRNLNAIDAKNEAQRLRLEHVNAFRKWVRNN